MEDCKSKLYSVFSKKDEWTNLTQAHCFGGGGSDESEYPQGTSLETVVLGMYLAM